LKEKICWVWHILTTGKVWADEVIFREETARMLGKYLLSLTEPESTSNQDNMYWKTCEHCTNFIKPSDTICPVCGESQVE
jgi:uncharacterized paraquat-inducible protein A